MTGLLTRDGSALKGLSVEIGSNLGVVGTA